MAYSNFGAALAAYIVELQSGEPFYTYVKQNIFEVLGMDNTSIHPAQQDNPAVAQLRNNIQGYTTSLKLIKRIEGIWEFIRQEALWEPQKMQRNSWQL